MIRNDQEVSHEVLKLFSIISDFLDKSVWKVGVTKSGSSYKSTTHAYSEIRIYGDNNSYAYQIALKVKGECWHDFKKPVSVPNKSLRQVKELAFIALKGFSTDSEQKKELFRNIYKNIS